MTTELSPYLRRFVARKAFFKVFGQAFRIYDPDGGLRFYVKQKAFKLKEEITVYADESRQRPMLKIQARSIQDFSGTYDVHDAKSGEWVGAARRKGLKSILRDEWSLLDSDGQEVGRVYEDTGILALVRRFLTNLIPQTFVLELGGQAVGSIKQRFNPFVLTYDVDFSQADQLDPRMGVAIVVLLLAIEGRQN